MSAALYTSILQVHFNWCIADPASEALPKSNLAICEVCVYHLNRCKTSHWLLTNLQGDTAFHWDCVQRSYQWNGISSLASWTYLHQFCFHDGTWLTREPPSRYSNNLFYIWNYRWSFTIGSVASEPSQYFRRNHVADSILDFLDYFAETMSPIHLDYFVKTTSPIYNFWWRSWTWKSFRRFSIIRRRHR